MRICLEIREVAKPSHDQTFTRACH